MWDTALIDLFRSEVETHSAVLNSALLELERTPSDTSRIDEMMRSAHSIKGAARVVGVNPAVRVSHVMEDCFVAAQKGTLKIKPSDVDVLLRGVDLLANIAAATSSSEHELNERFETEVQNFVSELEMLLHQGKGAPEPAAKPNPVATSSQRQPCLLCAPTVLNEATAEQLRQQLVAAIHHQANQPVQIDLSQTIDLDVQGLAFLAAIPPYLAQHNLTGTLVRASAAMLTVLKTTGLYAQYAQPDTKQSGVG